MAETNTHFPETYLIRQAHAEHFGLDSVEEASVQDFVLAGLHSVAGLAQKGVGEIKSGGSSVDKQIKEARLVIDAIAARLNMCPRTFEDAAVINREQGDFVVVNAPGAK